MKYTPLDYLFSYYSLNAYYVPDSDRKDAALRVIQCTGGHSGESHPVYTEDAAVRDIQCMRRTQESSVHRVHSGERNPVYMEDAAVRGIQCTWRTHQ